MPNHDVVDLGMKNVGKVDLSDAIFGAEVKGHLIHEAVKTSLANNRTGTASSKNRNQVKATGAKAYRQKGTGRARHGSRSAPIFVGGGVVFGPRPRSFSLKLSKKKKRAALKAALSSKVEEKQLLIIDKWVEKKKTKEMVEVMKAMNVESALIVINEPCDWLERTVSNIPKIDVIYTRLLNTYDVIAHDHLICTQDVVAKIEEGLAQ